MSLNSTYMGFPISTIGVSSGLDWETNISAALSIIDQHDHTPGKGVPIPPSGLNINSDLSFAQNNATNLRAVRFYPQVSAIPNTGSDVGELYVVGNELYYNDVTGGNQVQLTTNGTVNATSSGISSGTATAAFSTGVLLVKSSSTSFANIAVQSVLLANAGNLSNQLTLQAPVLSGSYSLTLPAIPLAQSFLALDVSGNITAFAAVAGGLTGSMMANQTITATQILNATITGSQVAATTLTTSNMAQPPTNVGVTALAYSNATSSFTTILTSAAVSTLYSRPMFFGFSGPHDMTITDGGSGSTITIQVSDSANSLTFASRTYTLSASQVFTIPLNALSCFAVSINAGITTPTNFLLQAKVTSGTATIAIAGGGGNRSIFVVQI